MDRGLELEVLKGEGEVVERVARGWQRGQVSEDVLPEYHTSEMT